MFSRETEASLKEERRGINRNNISPSTMDRQVEEGSHMQRMLLYSLPLPAGSDQKESQEN